ncbi:MAG: cobalt-precorrin-5B (C(1))-methyltransferase, partial [Pseudomonadota bacterium]
MRKPDGPLRKGWTTGACATAGAKAAYGRLLTGAWEDPVRIVLPKGEAPAFPLADRDAGEGWAEATVIKDAGDDPDVTHGAAITTRVALGAAGSGGRFAAGEGVGVGTKPGLPIPPGEPAINPAPRAMIEGAIREIAELRGAPG